MGQPRRDSSGQLDQATFDRLYRQWSDAILHYLRRLVGPGPVSEDLFQETWMSVIEHWGQLRDVDRFGAWAYRIARNRAYNHHALRKRKVQVWILSNLTTSDDDTEGLNLLESAPDPGERPDGAAIAEERRKLLLCSLAALDPQTQEMIQLRFFEHLTLAEVAEVMDLPLGTIAARVHRALKQVQKSLKGQGIHGSHALQ